MLEKDHRIEGLHGRVEETDVVEGIRRRGDPPAGEQRIEPDGVHGVLSAVPVPRGYPGAEHQREIGGPAVHVTGLADLVEQLVRRDQREIREHDFDHRLHPGHRHPQAQTGESALRYRRVDYPVGILLGKPFGGPVRSAAEVGDLLAQHDHRAVSLEPPARHLGDGVREFHLFRVREVRRFTVGESLELGPVAPHPHGCRGGIGPELGPDDRLAARCVRTEGHRGIDGILGHAPDPLAPLGVDDTRSSQELGEAGVGVPGKPLVLLLLPAVAVAAPLEVAAVVEVAVALRLYDARTASLADAVAHLLDGPVDGGNVVAVHDPGVHPIPRRVLREVGNRADILRRRCHGVLVVLDEVDDREIIDGGEVRRLVERSLVRTAVAEEGDHDVPALAEFFGECRAGGQRDTSRDDRVRSQDPGILPSEVHRSAAAAAVPG